MAKTVFMAILLLQSLFAHEVCIENFAKKMCGDFRVLESVIVKSPLSKSELLKRIDKDIKQIAFLEDSNLYLVSSQKALSYAEELAQRDYIIYAQPNISQRRISSSHKSIGYLEKKYNLQESWKESKGEDVNIAIIDDGFDLSHEDLQGVNLAFSYDSDYKNFNASPKLKDDHHGTQVAGIIFAQHNGIGVDGIAPDANFIAIRQTTNITSDTIVSFTVAQKAGAQIINCSWNSPLLLEPVYDVIKHLAKDIAIVFAAGNEHKEILPYSTEASIPEVITVGSTQKQSNFGSIVDITIPSGIITTKPNDRYGVFYGTSATAPVVSGLLALKLSKHKNKSMQDLLASVQKDIYARD